MALPPLLAQHIELLRTKGCEIIVSEGQEICIEFKNYPIPKNIWNYDVISLLVITHPTYPNAKMDMFWVEPTLLLKNGAQPKATSPEQKCTKNWQRFSWHVNSWNPAHDNLITYLDVVKDRLSKAE